MHPSDERAIWTHEQDIAQVEVHQDMPPNLWLHPEQAIRDSVGEPYRWPLINKTSDVRQKVALLSSPTVDVWNHHMRRDDNDACGAIPRHPEEWPELSDEQIWHESNLPNLDKAADLTQMNRIWKYAYAPHRAGPSRYNANQSSQSSGSQKSRALQSRDQRH